MLTSCILFLTSARTIPGMKKQGRKRNYGVSVRISVTWLLRCVAFNPNIIQTCTLFYKNNLVSICLFNNLHLVQNEKKRKRKQEKDGKSKKKDFKF